MADTQTEPEADMPAAEAEIDPEELEEGEGAEGAGRQPVTFDRRASASLKRARRALAQAELDGEHKVRFHLEEANTLALLAIASALREGRQD